MELSKIEKNTLICKFLNIEIKGSEIVYSDNMLHLYKPSNIYEFESGIYDYTQEICDLNFNTSFDWLFLILDKIESLGFEYSLDKNGFFIRYINGNTQKGLFNGIDKKQTKIYNSCIEFIQWYNK